MLRNNPLMANVDGDSPEPSALVPQVARLLSGPCALEKYTMGSLVVNVIVFDGADLFWFASNATTYTE